MFQFTLGVASYSLVSIQKVVVANTDKVKVGLMPKNQLKTKHLIRFGGPLHILSLSLSLSVSLSLSHSLSLSLTLSLSIVHAISDLHVGIFDL